jgi:hypothetical protein
MQQRYNTRRAPVRSILLLSFLLLGPLGCGGSADSGDSGGEPEITVEEAAFAGVWVATDDKLGTMKLTVKGTDELECVLIDVRGKRFEFEEDPEFERELWSFETELDVGDRGIKVLFNQPETSLEVAGDMNYAMGSAMATFTRQQRDGVDVIVASFFRESRPEDTLRTINLVRKDPPVAAAGGQ